MFSLIGRSSVKKSQMPIFYKNNLIFSKETPLKSLNVIQGHPDVYRNIVRTYLLFSILIPLKWIKNYQSHNRDNSWRDGSHQFASRRDGRGKFTGGESAAANLQAASRPRQICRRWVGRGKLSNHVKICSNLAFIRRS